MRGLYDGGGTQTAARGAAGEGKNNKSALPAVGAAGANGAFLRAVERENGPKRSGSGDLCGGGHENAGGGAD